MNDIVTVSLSLIENIFHTFFWCFYYLLWNGKCWLGISKLLAARLQLLESLWQQIFFWKNWELLGFSTISVLARIIDTLVICTSSVFLCKILKVNSITISDKKISKQFYFIKFYLANTKVTVISLPRKLKNKFSKNWKLII